MSKWIDYLLEKPFFYDNIRAAITFGVRYSPIRKALNASSEDTIIDFGSGTGTYSKIFHKTKNEYTGVEISRQYYDTACARHNFSNIHFIHSDFFTLEKLEDKSFDLALMTGVLHHLTDEDCIRILTIINRVTRKRLIIQDLAPSRFHFISNFLM
ncbi:MAG: class I SAM-dependent methyltransferase, partial [Bacteroidota bacterium]